MTRFLGLLLCITLLVGCSSSRPIEIKETMVVGIYNHQCFRESNTADVAVTFEDKCFAVRTANFAGKAGERWLIELVDGNPTQFIRRVD